MGYGPGAGIPASAGVWPEPAEAGTPGALSGVAGHPACRGTAANHLFRQSLRTLAGWQVGRLAGWQVGRLGRWYSLPGTEAGQCRAGTEEEGERCSARRTGSMLWARKRYAAPATMVRLLVRYPTTECRCN